MSSTPWPGKPTGSSTTAATHSVAKILFLDLVALLTTNGIANGVIPAKIEGIASADANGEVVELIGRRNEVASGWRLALRVKRRDQNKPVELRAYLRGGNNAVSETWSYILPPD